MPAHHGTPMLQDKRFILTLLALAAVLALAALDRSPNEQVLTFLGLTLSAFSAQSQWGQTSRANAAPKAGV